MKYATRCYIVSSFIVLERADQTLYADQPFRAQNRPGAMNAKFLKARKERQPRHAPQVARSPVCFFSKNRFSTNILSLRIILYSLLVLTRQPASNDCNYTLHFYPFLHLCNTASKVNSIPPGTNADKDPKQTLARRLKDNMHKRTHKK